MDTESLREMEAALTRLGRRAVFGRGPKHPVEPRPELAGEVTKVLDRYPYLRSDDGLVLFLETYLECFVVFRDTGSIVTVSNFDESYFFAYYDPPEPAADAAFLFSTAILLNSPDPKYGHRTVICCDFQPTGPSGCHITASRITDDVHVVTERVLCDSFEDWLRLVIETKGVPL